MIVAIVVFGGDGLQKAEQTVGLAVATGGEIQTVGVGSGSGAESDRPQPVDRDRVAARIPQLTGEVAEGREPADPAVPEVTDQDAGAERPEILRRARDAPG